VKAAVLTIGNELVSGDVPNTNGSWLAKRLEGLGVAVVLIAAIPDELDQIATFVRREAPAVDHLVVTGGLGGTPDDITREALAAAFGVGQREVPELAEALRSRFAREPDYFQRFAQLPEGSRPLANPLGGAPGFQIANVWVLPGLPSEMEAMFDSVADELRHTEPIASWRCSYRTTESRIVGILEQAVERHPEVVVGSYPSFDEHGSEVEVVLKSRDAGAVAAAGDWVDAEIRQLAG
jgi:molybdenum cofactor synthesis domain-containing protein